MQGLVVVVVKNKVFMSGLLCAAVKDIKLQL